MERNNPTIVPRKNLNTHPPFCVTHNEAVEKTQKHSTPQLPRRFFEEAERVSRHGCFGDSELALAIL
jgi:hypothetical protein